MKQNKQLFHISYKLVFGLLGLSALVTEVATLVERGTFDPANFFSYFTIENNMLAVATLLLSALAVAHGVNRKLDSLRRAVTVYILVVGLGFWLLLSGQKDVAFTAVPWDNIVLHYIMPLAMAGDLLLDRPARRQSFQSMLPWLVFPVAYVTYTLVRGPLAEWYPYSFLDPTDKGYGAVALTVAGILVLTLALMWAVGRVGSGAADKPASSGKAKKTT